jgi:leucyl-tRNA synthetase
MQRYNPKDIEQKWQDTWEADKIYQATEDPGKPKKYILEYFPYPSGAAMHVGHVRNYTIGDVLARYNRMQGYNVLHPMGWDGFGLPAENYAIKNQVSPRVAIDQNTKRFKEQLIQMGFSYDWSREIDSTDPDYYRWTQWFFLLLYKKGLAYQKESPQWWCPVDKTVLANEQVEAGKCWRCGSDVEKKDLKQWFFKITDYADRLEKDLDNVDWSDSIKNMQRNWIGHKTGINITYKVTDAKTEETITVFTTRPDTNFGATFVVLAPEHEFVKKVINQEIAPKAGSSHWQAVEHYVQKSMAKSEIERQEEGRLKTGVFTGLHAKNELTGEDMPVWVSDFVLSGFGTGAVVGVPGHDMRDFQFAQTFHLPIKRVVVGQDGETGEITEAKQVQEASGKMVNSGFLDGLDIHEATEKVKDYMEEHGMGTRVHSYHIRDWLISRQRYWGAPIPMIHCPKDGIVPVPEDQLPVRLPELEKFEPSGDGRSPLATVPDFVNTTCPQCGGPAERETDTMDGFACSSWYFLRFADPHNDAKAFDADKAKFWLPVDDYIGGAEHAVMHLLYARMWTKVMHDEGLIDFDEPFTKLRNQGMILAPDGQKMSKSKGNTIEPGVLIDQGYGADSIRIMELFIGPWNQAANWSVEGMGGAFRFLQRVWTLVQEHHETANHDAPESDELNRAVHKTVKKITDDIAAMSFNTSIASLMELVNELFRIKAADNYAAANWSENLAILTQLIAPFAPHIAEELWQQLGHDGSVHVSAWPKYDDQYLLSDMLTVVVQINGKLRGQLQLSADADEPAVVAAARGDEKVKAHLDGKQIRKTIYVPGKLVNFVV